MQQGFIPDKGQAKPLLEVAGKPIVEHILKSWKK